MVENPSGAAPRRPCVLWVDEEGRILDCCDETEKLFAYRREELRNQHISLLVPGLAGVALVDDGGLNPRLAFRCHCDMPFEVVKRDGSAGRSRLSLNLVQLPAGRALSIIVHE